MFEIEPSLLRGKLIGNLIKEKIKEKNTTISKVAENINSQQSLLSRSLSGKVGVTDDYFIKIMQGIPLSEPQIKKIFQEADREEYKYKYGTDLEIIPPTPDDLKIIPEQVKLNLIEEIEDDFLKEMSLSREFRNNDKALEEAKKIWEYIKDEIDGKNKN